MEDNRTDQGNDQQVMSAADDASEAGRVAAADPDELQRQRDEYYDLLLRKTAEFDNFRKRIDRERQAVSEAAAADLIAELLPLVDDMERALKADAGKDVGDAVLFAHEGFPEDCRTDHAVLRASSSAWR